jgi:hypothetical protein
MSAEEPGGIVSVEAEGDTLTIGVREDPEEHGTCPHPAPRRRLVENSAGDTEQVCLDCAQVIDAEEPPLIPRDRGGTTDPTAREGTDRTRGGLRHITWDPERPYASRPYTPEEVELEIADTLDRIERGAGWLTTREEERGAAKIEYEIARARALLTATGKTAEQRAAAALLACRAQYERWQVLELTCKTAAEGMHNLRSKLSGLQSILRSASAALSGGGWDR